MRLIIPIVAVVALVLGLAAIKANQIGLLVKTGEAAKQAGPPPTAVGTGQVTRDTWRSTIYAVGTVAAGRGVTISNDSTGLVTQIHFESGDTVKAGAPLVELETSVERAQLESTLSQLELAETTLKRTRALVAEGVSSAQELDSAASSVKTLRAEAQGLRAQIGRKVVRAPFAGKLGIREVNKGQYLSPGSPITTLQSAEGDYVDFTVPQEYLDQMQVGLEVELWAPQGSDLQLKGVVAAVEPEVNQATRAVTIRASTQDPKQRLHPGMFLNVRVLLDETRDVLLVPTTAVVYAPYGDSVFLVEPEPEQPDKQRATQQFVRLGETRGDFVEVTKGLDGDETLVTEGAFKLRNGAPVSVNNSVTLNPRLDPKPENR